MGYVPSKPQNLTKKGHQRMRSSNSFKMKLFSAMTLKRFSNETRQTLTCYKDILPANFEKYAVCAICHSLYCQYAIPKIKMLCNLTLCDSEVNHRPSKVFLIHILNQGGGGGVGSEPHLTPERQLQLK